jgi:predicted nucleic acid-binding Zn ribbon protein
MIMIMGQYKCLDCGYSGPFVMEMDDDAYEELLLDDARKKE